MTIKTLLTSAALALATATAGFASCSGHREAAMSCADGMVYSAETGTCILATG